jgi:general stress protein 26
MTTDASQHVSRNWSFDDLRADVAAIMSATNYTTMTTVDRQGRPRSRVLIVVWQLDGPEPVGWLGTYKTRIKAAHLDKNPHVSTSYWSPRQDALYLDSVARWVDDAQTAAAVWDMYRNGSPKGVGYEPGQFWKGPNDPEFHVLRLAPWRVQVLTARDLVAGRPSRIWRKAAPKA